MNLQIDKRFRKKVQGIFEKYEFQVGIINDRAHRNPLPKSRGLSSYAGGPVRRKSTRSSNSVSEVSESARKTTGINFYTRPFSSKKNQDILNFTKAFFDLCSGRAQARRAENLLQAIVRNPILRGDYGRNTKATAKIKGFSRLLIDTGQLFRSIVAKVKVRRVS